MLQKKPHEKILKKKLNKSFCHIYLLIYELFSIILISNKSSSSSIYYLSLNL